MKVGDPVTIKNNGWAVTAWKFPDAEDSNCNLPPDRAFDIGSSSTVALVIAGPVDTPNLRIPGHNREWKVMVDGKTGWVKDELLEVVP